MNILETDIPGVLILEPKVFTDPRGYFFESFSERAFHELTGLDVRFVQDNESMSSYGVIRGLHFQAPPAAQAKLVRCVSGEVLDVAVDIRAGSPTFGKHVAARLSAANRRQLFIPRGFAHGFAVLSPTAVFQYKCDNYYSPADEGGIDLADPCIGISWPVNPQDAILSEKDRRHPRLSELQTPFIF